MRPYLSAFRIRFINGLQYRASALGEMLSRCMWAFMEILAFQALYKTGESGFSMELSQTVSYIWMQQIFYILFKAVYGDEDICASIAGALWLMSLFARRDCMGVGSALRRRFAFHIQLSTACPSFW